MCITKLNSYIFHIAWVLWLDCNFYFLLIRTNTHNTHTQTERERQILLWHCFQVSTIELERNTKFISIFGNNISFGKSKKMAKKNPKYQQIEKWHPDFWTQWKTLNYWVHSAHIISPAFFDNTFVFVLFFVATVLRETIFFLENFCVQWHFFKCMA